ncbi:MAG: glycosyltransferase [Proteobacteria bacterium]|nr:glycosyltransferase [Pseudomonadota bacterium]
MKYISYLVLLIATVASLATWSFVNQPATAPDWTGGTLTGLSYSPYGAGQDPVDGDMPTAEMIGRDLDLLRGQTTAIRTYSVDGVLRDIPSMAADRGLSVMPGAWIGPDKESNRRETDNLIQIAQHESNVRRVLVGNESLLRKDISPEALIVEINRVRSRTRIPVSTAETWDIWLANPALAAAVDFIGVQVLPYWEGIPAEEAVRYTFARLAEVKAAYPGKHIVLTETGWPSKGRKNQQAEASRILQVTFLRQFANAAAARNLDYYIIEAFDQPWKVSPEGLAGGYWGIFDADRQLKFSWSGPVLENDNWLHWAQLAALLGLLPAAAYMARRPDLQLGGMVLTSVNSYATATMLVLLLMTMAGLYLTVAQSVLWGVLLASALFLLVGVFIDGLEASDLLWNGDMQRHFGPGRPEARPRMVSIHVAICKEPPEMVRRTLSALAALDYPNFEVIVVDNNTPDPAMWKPVEAYCQVLGSRFRFIHRDTLPGYKAGALNLALSETAPEAEIIAVIDSDYVVASNWLADLTPHFADPEIGLVQAPQDYSDLAENRFKASCYWEYKGFFHIGMVRRNEADAIIQHGTMTMVRQTALRQAGGWAEWCITEDAELGLQLASLGWKSAYTARSYGKGVMPDTMRAYKMQRLRWAYGAVQIMKRHWRWFLTGGNTKLTPAQRFHYVAGWLPWLTDAAGLIFTVAALVWTVLLATMRDMDTPPVVVLVPALGAFIFRQWRVLFLYRRTVACTAQNRWGAALAGLALNHTVAKAVLQGLVTSGCPYQRTPKKRSGPQLFQAITMADEETFLLAMLTGAAILYAVMRAPLELADGLWLAALCVMALPYAAALALTVINATATSATRDKSSDGLLNLPHDATPVNAEPERASAARGATN